MLCSSQLAEAAKSQFSGDYSDHLALVRAYEGWKDAERDIAGYEYCWRNFLSLQSMKAIDSLRKEFFSLLKDTGLVDGNSTSCNAWSHDDHLIRAVICYGLYPGICSVVVSHGFTYLLKLSYFFQSSQFSFISYSFSIFWCLRNPRIMIKIEKESNPKVLTILNLLDVYQMPRMRIFL